jgi:osmoprotectant transport system ATP-binding protein
MLKLDGVTKYYGPTHALGPIDLSVSAGSSTVVVGPSGSGKSTLLRIILGLVPMDTGRIQIAGIPLAPRNLPQIRRRAGYVTQAGGLFPHLTARRNIALGAKLDGWDGAATETRIDELCTLTHFPMAALSRYPSELSGGQQQRVALMRALMLDPDVLLLDEPLGALDPLIRADLQEDLKAIFAKHDKTVLLVTHDLTEAAHFADDVVLLQAGRVVQQGPFAELIDRPVNRFVTRFVNAQRLSFESA